MSLRALVWRMLAGIGAAMLIHVTRQPDATLRRLLATACLIASEPPHRLPTPVAGVEPTQLRDRWGAPRSG